ncbi:hypothetical protein JM16_006667 [Phytophthora kernoviae]|uniref:C2H2-type domain-containing protein n=1 Tax=Phytophthora kernoviae TaxID=325452 RepID=A0A8T0LTJ7_9STRA|nr:hypothetical protein JM16_006667 [Phytophthora kernoviae]
MKRSHKNLNVPFECSECLLAFKKKSDLQAHSHEELEKHKRTAHVKDEKVDGEEDIVGVRSGGGKVEDEGSSAVAKVEGSADVKMEQGTSSSLLCRVCDRTFQRKQILRAHLRTHFESLDERKEYVCPMPRCDKAYTRKSNLMAHYNAVHDERKSRRFTCPCEGCSARFGYKTTLTRHIDKVHDNPKPPKRRQRSSAGILARALGVNQVGEDTSRANSSGGDEGAASTAIAQEEVETQEAMTIVQEVIETLSKAVAAAIAQDEKSEGQEEAIKQS